MYYLAPNSEVWWPVIIKNGMVYFPFNRKAFPTSECPGKFSRRPTKRAADECKQGGMHIWRDIITDGVADVCIKCCTRR